VTRAPACCRVASPHEREPSTAAAALLLRWELLCRAPEAPGAGYDLRFEPRRALKLAQLCGGGALPALAAAGHGEFDFSGLLLWAAPLQDAGGARSRAGARAAPAALPELRAAGAEATRRRPMTWLHPATPPVPTLPPDDRGNVTQWVFLADETTPGVPGLEAAGDGQQAVPQEREQMQQQRAGAGAGAGAVAVLAVQLTGPKGLIDFLEPSDASSFFAPAGEPGGGGAAAVAAPAARRASGPLPLGGPSGGSGGELKLLRLQNLVLAGTDWSDGGGPRLINARGGETLAVAQMSPAKARVQAPALAEWARRAAPALAGVQEALRRLVS
jgi:hypothetical protein